MLEGQGAVGGTGQRWNLVQGQEGGEGSHGRWEGEKDKGQAAGQPSNTSSTCQKEHKDTRESPHQPPCTQDSIVHSK